MISENIYEWLNDENKLVTCKLLSKELTLPINKSKEILLNFQAGHMDYKTIYYIETATDKLSANKIYKLGFCYNDYLKNIKMKIQTPLYTEVFGLKKEDVNTSNPVLNLEIDRSCLDTRCYAIKCEEVKKRTADELKISQTVDHQKENNFKMPPPVTKTTVDNTPVSLDPNQNKMVGDFFASVLKKPADKSIEKVVSESEKSSTKISKPTGAKQKATIQSMFANAPPKTQIDKKGDSSVSENKSESKCQKKSNDDLGSTKASIKEDNSGKGKNDRISDLKKENTPKVASTISVEGDASDEEDVTCPEQSSQSKESSQGKRKSNEDEGDEPITKRRRIIVNSDDSDEDNQEKEDESISQEQSRELEPKKRGRKKVSKIETGENNESSVPKKQYRPRAKKQEVTFEDSDEERERLENESRKESDEMKKKKSSGRKSKSQTDETEETRTPRPTMIVSEKRNRNRRKVLKTFLDEDGFMVTDKVWESYSEDECEDNDSAKCSQNTSSKMNSSVESSVTKNSSPNKSTSQNTSQNSSVSGTSSHSRKSPSKKNKDSGKTSGKQTSLTSFFKKA